MSARTVLKIRDFRLLWLAQVISDFGDSLTNLTLLILINQLTGSTAALATMAIVLGIPQELLTFGGGNFLGVPDSVYVVAGFALLAWYLLEQTPYGRSLHAIGSNKAAARLVGIRVERSVFLAFIVSGASAGLAGVLLLASSGAGNPQIGQSFTLTAVAAAFLGAASFKVGQLNVLGSIVAILFLAVNITGLTFLGVQDWINQLFTGAALVVAIAFSTALHRERKHRARPAPQEPASRP